MSDMSTEKEYGGYTIGLTKDMKFEIKGDDLEGTVRDTYEQAKVYIDRVIAGRGKIKKEKIALKVLATQTWGRSDEAPKAGVVTGIHMGHGTLIGVEGSSYIYPDVPTVVDLLSRKKDLNAQLRKVEDQLSRRAIEIRRKPHYGELDPGKYPEYIAALIKEYKEKAAL